MLLKLSRRLLYVLFTLSMISPAVVAQTSLAIPWNKLQTGDILLLSLECRVCKLIELEEGLPFSHMAIFVKTGTKFMIMEAWADGVKLKNVSEFFEDKRMTKNSEVVILRHIKVKNTRRNLLTLLPSFEGLSYDSNFLWDNVDEYRRPKLYCSEFVYKVYEKWLGHDFTMKTKAMNYRKYWNDWYKYFQGKIPQGKMGISPGDYLKSFEFEIVAKLTPQFRRVH